MKRVLLALLLLPAFASAQFTDDFNRADELLDASSNWDRPTADGQNVNVVSNQLETGTQTGRRLYRSPDQSDADQYVQADVPTLTNHPANTVSQIVLRATDRINYIGIGVSASGNIDCGIREANVYTSFWNGTPAGTVQALKVEAEGNTIRCYYDVGAGFVLADTEINITTFNSITRAGITDASGTSGKPMFDNYENGALTTPTDFVDWVAEIETHFDTDHTLGTTYYFNSDATGNDSGTSNANAFTTCGQVDAKNFTAGDNLLFMEDQATTCDQKIKNDTMVGDNAGNHFHMGAYHMSGGVETPGKSGGPYSNTPDGRPCLDGGDFADYDYFGGMTNAQVQALIPPVTGNPMVVGVLEGVLNWYQASNYDLDLHIDGLCVRASGGRHIRFTQTGSAVANYLLLEDSYFQGAMTQSVHLSGVRFAVVKNNWLTQSDAERTYGTTPGNTQACMAFKGTTGDPDTSVYVAFKNNVIWDSLCSEGVQSNSGGRSVLIENNVIIDAGHVAGIYLDRTNDMTVRRNFIVHTARTAFEIPGTLDWGGIVVQNEQSCGSFDWCSAYSDPADFAAYATQNAVISDNLVVGWRYGMTFQSQASGTDPNTHLGEAHGACVYYYNNMVLDPDDRFFSINNAAPTSNYVLRTDCPPRVWGNAFMNFGEVGNNVLVERNDTQFATVFDYNYMTSDITVASSYDQNITTTGITMPLADYSDLSSYMTLDADNWMSYTNVRAFLSAMGINPDNLADKDMELFRPTASVASGLALSVFTFPTNNITGEPDDTDIEGNTYTSTPYFGPFATVGASSSGLLLKRRRH